MAFQVCRHIPLWVAQLFRSNTLLNREIMSDFFFDENTD